MKDKREIIAIHNNCTISSTVKKDNKGRFFIIVKGINSSTISAKFSYNACKSHTYKQRALWKAIKHINNLQTN